MMSLHWTLPTYQMLIAVPGSISTFGGAGLASLAGTGDFDFKDRHQVLKDVHSLKGAVATAKSMLELAELIKAGKQTIEKN
jgi:hypothetical protein